MNTLKIDRVIPEPIHPLCHIQQQQGYHALSIWWAFPNIIAMIIGLDRGHIICHRIIQISLRMMPAKIIQLCKHIFGNPAFIKSIAPVFGNFCQGAGKGRLAVGIACDKRAAFWQKYRAGISIALQQIETARKIKSYARRNSIAISGIANSRGQNIYKTHAPMIAVQRYPCIHRCWHRHRMGRLLGNAGQTLFA